jgi:photosystem II stability/assembly factor-like uncharacterized protein
MVRYSSLAASLALTLSLTVPAIVAPAPVWAQAADPVASLFKDLPWRAIGPAIMGGRIDDIAVVESDPRVVYMATAGGGIFKTVNNGTTWEAIFDGEKTSSIGDLAIAPSDPNVVYAGTGESNNRQSSSWGYGVYRSSDAGKTWTHCGLAETMHIGRVVVHPKDPNTVYVAAAGRLWGPNPERGVYKSADGGKTWEKVLFINDDTGVNDIVIDPENPDTLYAAAYQRRRTAFGFVGGGPHSALYKTTDGGKTWKKLENGLPAGTIGRIGLDIYRKNPKVLMALVETRNSGSTQSPQGNGALFRTEDGGETWKQVSEFNPRPMYFSQIRIDPTDEQRVYVLGVSQYTSDNGGRTFRVEISRVHADGHALWINPKDPNHLILGTDGGIQWSWDRGKTWDFVNTIPLAQFYEVHYDFRQPYWVYGGLQDNGTWGAPSATLSGGGPNSRGVTNDEWINVGGGDGFYAQADPTDPSIIYTESQFGAVRRLNVTTGESKSIRPPNVPGEPAYLFDWNTPIFISPHDPKKILLGSKRLFISNDRGDSWRRTDDLTTGVDRDKLPIMGSVPTRQTLSLHDGTNGFGYIVTLAESPAKVGVIWAGTDDGNLQVSQDDGKTWKNVASRLPGVPKGTFISRVHPSRFAPGLCYVSVDGHRSDDFKPYIFVTEDFGETWQQITAGIAEGDTVSVVREHPRTQNLLFAGTERGLYVSFDRGIRWHKFPAPVGNVPVGTSHPLPTVPVDDIQIHPRDNDLILATHGRGVYILDDIGVFETVAAGQVASGTVVLAPPKPAVQYRLANRKAVTGHKIYIAPNPPSVASLSFYVKDKPADGTPVTLSVVGSDGKMVREIRPSRVDAGWNRVSWDMRHGLTLAAPQGGPGDGGRGGGGGAGGGGGFSRGPRVLPGTYTVRLTVGKETQAQPIRVDDDPRITLTEKERKQSLETQMRVAKMLEAASLSRSSLDSVRRQLTDLVGKNPPAPVKASAEDLLKRVTALQAQIAPIPGRSGSSGAGSAGAGGAQPPAESESAPTPPPPTQQPMQTKLLLLLVSIDSLTEVPSKAVRDNVEETSKAVKRLVDETNQLMSKSLSGLNRQLTDAKLTPIQPAVPALSAEEEAQIEIEEGGEREP